MKMISVVIPVYNAEKYLEKCDRHGNIKIFRG